MLKQKGRMELGMIDEDEFVVQVGRPRADIVRRAIEVCRDTRILRDATTINYQPSARRPTRRRHIAFWNEKPLTMLYSLRVEGTD